MEREEDRRRGADVSLHGEQYAHAHAVGRGDASLSMEIIESGVVVVPCVCLQAAMIESPALGATEEVCFYQTVGFSGFYFKFASSS